MIVVSVSAAASSPARPASAQPRMRLFAHPLRLDNAGAGTSFYVKESGTGTTGWVGK